MRIEDVIFSNLLFNEEYGRKVIPYLKADYFHENTDRVVFELIDSHVGKYNSFPTPEALHVDLLNRKGLNEELFKNVKELVSEFRNTNEPYNPEWLMDKTEAFCKDKALYNALMQSINVIDGGSKKDNISVGEIPKLLSDALAVSFDPNIGHDYLEDAEERFDFYNQREHKIPFKLSYFNKITKGGVSRKTLNVALAGTGVGKSLLMCACAANNLTDGLNVLYITLEMAEERISERIDANLLDMTIDSLKEMPKESFLKKINRVKGKTSGKLIVKEYPPASVGSANFRHLLNELALKKKFIPDIIYIDYINLCVSSRIKMGSNQNTYTIIKAIAEELRGLAVEFNVPVFTATQTTRSGFDNSDVDLTDTSESFGLPATADFMFAVISDEKLDELNQYMVKQLKNRYGDLNLYRRFVIGVNKPKMQLYDVEQSAQENIVDDKPKTDEPVMDNTDFGERAMDDPEYRKNKLRTLK